MTTDSTTGTTRHTTTPEAGGTSRRARRPSPATRVVGTFRNPLHTFLVLAIAVGGFCVFAIPWFGGIDEPAHFYRSYQISTGTLVPEEIPGSDFSGACLPSSLTDQVEPYQAAYFRHLLTLVGGPERFDDFDEIPAADGATGAGTAEDDPGAQAGSAPECASADETPLTFSTFGSPVPYAPQTASVLVGRALGMSAGPMLILGRIVMLAVYVGLVGLAIKRSPRAKWAMAAVALVPVALFQSVGWSHDAITTAVALLLVSSALRTLDPPQGATVRGLVIEAVLLSVLLGCCKPVYAVIAGLYLLPLLGRGRRGELWPMVLAPIAAVVTSVVLNEVGGGQWRTDADYFGIRPDDAARSDELTSAPWHFLADSVRTVPEEAWNWVDGLWSVGMSVTNWPAVVPAVAAVLYLLVSLQRDRDEPARGLNLWQRGLVVLVLLAGFLLVLGANYVYWTTPGNDVITGVQARYLEPLLVLIPVAIGGINVRWLRSRDTPFPLAVLLVPFLALFCVVLALRMH